MQPSETCRTRGWLVLRAAPFEERETVGIEQLAAARLDECAAVALVDQPEQREQPAPGAAPLVHRVGIERGVLDQPGVEAAHGIAGLVELPRARRRCSDGREVAVLGIEDEDEPHQDREQALVEMAGADVRASSRIAIRSAASRPRSSSCSAPSTCSASAVETAACASRLRRQERRQTAVVGVGEQAEAIEQQLQPAEHRPAGDGRQSRGAGSSDSRRSRRAAHRSSTRSCLPSGRARISSPAKTPVSRSSRSKR